MTKKKNGFFSNLKNKFKKNKNIESSDDFDSTELDASADSEEYDDEEYEEGEGEDYEEVDDEFEEEFEDSDYEDEAENLPSKQAFQEMPKPQSTSSTPELEASSIDGEDLEEEFEDSEYEDDAEFEEDENAEFEADEEDEEHEYENALHVTPSFKNKVMNASQNLFSRFQRNNKNADPDSTNSNFSNPLKASSNNAFSEITLDQIIPRILGVSNQYRIHHIFIVAFFFFTFYFVGKIAGLFLSQKSEARKITNLASDQRSYSPRNDIAAIRSNNIFNARENEEQEIKPQKSNEPEIKICLDASKRSSLPIKLVNTIVLQDSVKSVASVSERGKVANLREGEKIGSFAEIGKIDRLRLIFKNLQSGQCEYVENLDEKQKAASKEDLGVQPAKKAPELIPNFNKEIETDGNKFAIKKALRDKLLSNIGEVLTQARAVQIKNPDGTLAFKMTEIVPGSIFSNLNIQDGDIITGVNGKKISNVNELMSMFGKIKENDTYEITVRRNGSETNLNYNFVE